jgi:hypothetical protein
MLGGVWDAVSADPHDLVHCISKEPTANGDVARGQRRGLGLAQREAGEEESDDRLLLLDVHPAFAMSICSDLMIKIKNLPLCT